MVYYDKEFIAKKIRYYRKKAGLTQGELAELVEVSAKQMSRIEVAAYVPSVPTFLKIVDVLKIDLSEFGLNQTQENKRREEFIKFIYSMTDSEVEFGFSVLKNIFDEMNTLKGAK